MEIYVSVPAEDGSDNQKLWTYVAKELWGPIHVEMSSWVVKQNKIVMKLKKSLGQRDWDKWQKIRRI